MRGYFGIGIYQPKNSVNIGTLWRSAKIMGADYLFTIGARYKRQAADTCKAPRHMPLFHYTDFADFKAHLPENSLIVGVEMHDDAPLLCEFAHPQQAAYLLGAEDFGLPESVIESCHRLVKLPGNSSLNVSTCGSIIVYDRITRMAKQ